MTITLEAVAKGLLVIPLTDPLKPKQKPAETQGERFEFIEEELTPVDTASDLLNSCLIDVAPTFDCTYRLSAKSESEIVVFVTKILEKLQKEGRAFSAKCIDVHKRFNRHLADLAQDLTLEDHEKICANWREKGKAIFKLVHNGKNGRDGGVASDLLQLYQLVTVCSQKALFAELDKQKSDTALAEIEFPNLWGGDPIKLQKTSKLMDKDFVLMKNLYKHYYNLLYGCIDHLNELARPIYKTLGIIQCFPDKLHLIAPYKKKPEEKNPSLL